nr:unnamed protein product [Digitaria exilis]CAB3471363.1 unnamed protein product [Digitaria exilis]
MAMAPPPPPPAATAPAADATKAGGPHSVFVYGSLMADEVVRAILNRVPPAAPALLPNYHRFNVKGRVYPGILPVDSKKVAGMVLMGVTDEELQLLDAFEDVEYTRTRVEISLNVSISQPCSFASQDSSEKMLADTYVWSDAHDSNLYGEWDFEVSVQGFNFVKRRAPATHGLGHGELRWPHGLGRVSSGVPMAAAIRAYPLPSGLPNLASSEYLIEEELRAPGLLKPSLHVVIIVGRAPYSDVVVQEWKKVHMKAFLAMTNGFMHGLQQSETKTRVETYESFMQQQEHPTLETHAEG